MANQETSSETARSWLLAVLVIAATAGAMAFLSGDGDDEKKGAGAKAAETKDEEVLEVQPLIPEGRIVSASWRSGDTATTRPETEVVESSVLDDANLDALRGGDEMARKKEESLRKTIDRIHGLGVYVAPEGEDE